MMRNRCTAPILVAALLLGVLVCSAAWAGPPKSRISGLFEAIVLDAKVKVVNLGLENTGVGWYMTQNKNAKYNMVAAVARAKINKDGTLSAPKGKNNYDFDWQIGDPDNGSLVSEGGLRMKEKKVPLNLVEAALQSPGNLQAGAQSAAGGKFHLAFKFIPIPGNANTTQFVKDRVAMGERGMLMRYDPVCGPTKAYKDEVLVVGFFVSATDPELELKSKADKEAYMTLIMGPELEKAAAAQILNNLKLP